ncbi:TPA: hypothetical protein ACH3X3_007293 [Trebouxia sp. C0006]
MALLSSWKLPRAPTLGAPTHACLRAPASRIVPKATAAVQDAPALGEQLLNARKVAMDLFVAIESKGILAPGCTETDIDKQVFDLAAVDFGTQKHWHQRLPRVGENTIHPIYDKVADVALQEDDIVYVDLGPVFGDMEADFGRTYVLGRLQEVAMSTPIPTTVHTWWANFHMIWSLVMTLSTMHVLSAVRP